MNTEDKMISILICGVIESLIREIESQGMDYVTTTSLRKFIHNIETNRKVVGKIYRGKVDV